MNGIDVTFNVGTAGNADKRLDDLAKAAVRAADAQAKLANVEKQRREGNANKLDKQWLDASNKFVADPNDKNQKAVNAARERAEKNSASEIERVMRERKRLADKELKAAEKAVDDEIKAMEQEASRKKREREKAASEAASAKKQQDAKDKRETEKAEKKAKSDARDMQANRQSVFQQAMVMGRMGRAASTYGNMTAMGEATTGAGMGGLGAGLAKFAGPAAIAVAIGAAIKGVVDTLGKVSTLRQDEYLTSSQRYRSFLKDIPVVGWGIEKYDELSGRKRDMTRATEDNDRAESVRQVEQRSRDYRLNLNNRIDAADARVSATSGARVVGLPSADRSTALGRQMYAEQMRLMPLIQDQARAERDATAATKTVAGAKGRQAELETEYLKMTAMRNQYAKEEIKALDGEGNASGGPGRVRFLGGALRNEQNIQANLENQIKQKELVANAGDNAAQANATARNARLGVEQGRLDIAREQESTAANQRYQIGTMGAGGRAQALMAIRLVKNVPLDNLPPEVIQQAAAIAPNLVRTLAEKQSSSYIQDFRNEAPDDFRFDLEAKRKEVDDRQGNVAGMALQNEQMTAREMRANLNALETVIGDFGKNVISKINEFNTNLKNIRSQGI